jgi:Membrane proteins related to metalloendopeptidases
VRWQVFAVLASTAAGLDDATAMAIADIFQWDIDFVLDIRRGDGFRVALEELWLDGEKLGYGAILAAEFTNRGEVFRAVRYTDREGYTSYYTPDGMSMRKAFLRAPVQFSRISSNFNMRRRHPLHDTIRPHRGIDYAAPRGTPVVAAGEGRVVRVEKNHYASGNYVVIQHGETYQTKYLHLSRFARGMRSGVRVNQGDVIGYVGATGWATGPHLHYEFLVHGVHQNPRTVDLPKALPIADAERMRFQAATGALVALLESDPDTQIALAPTGASTGG